MNQEELISGESTNDWAEDLQVLVDRYGAQCISEAVGADYRTIYRWLRGDRYPREHARSYIRYLRRMADEYVRLRACLQAARDSLEMAIGQLGAVLPDELRDPMRR